MITNAALIVYAVCAAVCLICYIPKLKQLFYAKHRLPHKTATEKRRLSVIVPAREESEIVGDLFASIAEQDYDRRYFSVNVVVDREDDPTVSIAKSYGFNVFVVPDQKCKGDALDGYLKGENKEVFDTFDAFVIVDADAVLTHDYLTELNNALEYDAQIFLSRKHIKNFYGDRHDRTIFTNCSALTYAQLDDLGNIYRTDHDMPLTMCGQGMMVRRETIVDLGGWPYRTLTEDYEMRMDCYLKGYKSLYYPYAVICTEEPLRHRENFNRRMRWLTGYSQCDRMYKGKVRKQAKARGKATAGEWELFHGLDVPIAFLIITLIAVLAGVGITVYGGVTGAYGWLYPLLALIVTPLVVIYLALFIYGVMCIRSMEDAFENIPLHEKIFTVLYEPLFALEYVPIYIASKFKAKYGWDWKPTKHIRYKGGLHRKAKKHESPDSDESGESDESEENAVARG